MHVQWRWLMELPLWPSQAGMAVPSVSLSSLDHHKQYFCFPTAQLVDTVLTPKWYPSVLIATIFPSWVYFFCPPFFAHEKLIKPFKIREGFMTPHTCICLIYTTFPLHVPGKGVKTESACGLRQLHERKRQPVGFCLVLLRCAPFILAQQWLPWPNLLWVWAGHGLMWPGHPSLRRFSAKEKHWTGCCGGFKLYA